MGNLELPQDAHGFCRAEGMATLTGQRFYRALGYAAAPATGHPLGGGLTIAFVPMGKNL